MTKRGIQAILEIVGTVFFFVMMDTFVLALILAAIWLFFGARLVSFIYVPPVLEDNKTREN